MCKVPAHSNTPPPFPPPQLLCILCRGPLMCLRPGLRSSKALAPPRVISAPHGFSSWALMPHKSPTLSPDLRVLAAAYTCHPTHVPDCVCHEEFLIPPPYPYAVCLQLPSSADSSSSGQTPQGAPHWICQLTLLFLSSSSIQSLTTCHRLLHPGTGFPH